MESTILSRSKHLKHSYLYQLRKVFRYERGGRHGLQISLWNTLGGSQTLECVRITRVCRLSRFIHVDSLRHYGPQPARLLCPWILQARILEWVAITFCRGSSLSRDQIQISRIAGRFFIVWATHTDFYLNFSLIPHCYL